MRVLVALLILSLGACAPVPAPTEPGGSSEPARPSGIPPSGKPDPEGEARLAENRARWTAQQPDTYRFTYTRNCFCPQEYRGPFAIAVQGGEVAEVTYEGEGEPIEDALTNASLTIDDLFDLVAEAYERKAFSVTVDYAETGQPTNIYIDYNAQIADEEVGFTIEPVRPAGD